MWSFFFLTVLCLAEWSNCQTCPTKYKRFSTEHTFCLSPNPVCQIKRTGVSQQDKELILRLHNELRSKVAMGNEHGAIGGSLPQAADMMQLEWDDELAAVAQKWAENCYWDHDCDDCRAVENFGVGQNLARVRNNPNSEPNWAPRIQGLYNEVKDYYKNQLGSFQSQDDPMIGHFTQLIWAKSWRIGCGYAFYKKNNVFEQYYACNYGPGGNILTKPVYTPGRPCSACPTNTQCSTSSRGANTFPGLCKMNNPNTAPAISKDGLLFACVDSSRDSDCKVEVSGDGNWKTVHSVGGDYNSIVLRGGQSTTVSFTTPIQPHGQGFCLRPTFRKGPLNPNSNRIPVYEQDNSILKLNFKMGRGMRAGPMTLKLETTSFEDLGIGLRWGAKTQISFTFSVPSGAGEHVLDIRKIIAFDGDCSSR